ncbi:hypothetical protein [Streptomyces sp. yr375]|uniref:hypothetical protein n=1 Tax=Streptomyces sp. yr375 TaxID=1761906 RepID=UPI000B851BEB|nr:hypothetical protein [Streptomyces sp. yr375]
MDDSNAKRKPKHPSRWAKKHSDGIHRLRKWIGEQGRRAPGAFLQGAMHQLGSGAVTMLILWWQTHR